MSSPARDTFWDASRAALMWLVILGHTIQELADGNFFTHPLFKGIYLFHIPLFFFISGYFAYSSIRKHRWQSISRSATRLLLPVFSLGTLRVILLLSKSTITPGDFFGCYVCLWFLWSLFECQVFGCILLHYKQPVWRFIWILIPLLLNIYYPSSMPYAEYMSFTWPFYLLGMWGKSKGFTSQHINTRWYWALPAAILFYFTYQDTWYIYLSPLSISPESAGIALFRIAAALAAGSVFLALMHQCPATLHIAKIGTSTLGIYVIQCILCNLVSRFSFPPFTSQVWFMLPLSLLVFFLCYWAYLLTRKIPLVGMLVYGDPLRRISTKP